MDIKLYDDGFYTVRIIPNNEGFNLSLDVYLAMNLIQNNQLIGVHLGTSIKLSPQSYSKDIRTLDNFFYPICDTLENSFINFKKQMIDGVIIKKNLTNFEENLIVNFVYARDDCEKTIKNDTKNPKFESSVKIGKDEFKFNINLLGLEMILMNETVGLNAHINKHKDKVPNPKTVLVEKFKQNMEFYLPHKENKKSIKI